MSQLSDRNRSQRMANLKRLIGKVKDKASEGKATVVHAFRPNTKSLHLAILKSTTHNCEKPPADDYVAAVLSYTRSRRYAPAAVSAVLSRLRATRDACVAAKSLIVLHKLVKPDHGLTGEIYIKDHHLFYTEGRKDLILNNFRDHSSRPTLELSPWVRWYVQYQDCLSSTSRILGYFPNITSYSKEKAVEKHRVSSYKTGYLVDQTGFLVSFLECICQSPENPELYRNKIVDQIRELVSQDYYSVIPLIMVRLEVLSERLAKPDLGYTSSDRLGPVLVRLEETKEKLMGFAWRCKVLGEDFWFVVRELKGKVFGENRMIPSYRDVDTGVNESVRETFDEPVQSSAWETFDEPVQFSVWETFDEPVQLSVWETFDEPVRLNS